MIPSDPDDRDVLAGEYVLGHLDDAVRMEIEGALATDRDLAGRVAVWEARLLPALLSLPPVVPDPALWSRIERGLGPAVAPPSLSAEARTTPVSTLGRLWRSAPVWRGVAGLATAAALLLAVFPVRDRMPAEPAPRYFAILQARAPDGTETGPGWVINIAQDGTVRSIPLADVVPGRDQALQLWTLWDQARGPVSLGVLPPGGSVRLPPERLPMIGSDQLFEITLERREGSPTGRPTGPILFIGRTTAAPTRPL